MALVVHRSNRLERLAARLADVVREPLQTARFDDPFARECIVVQGPGMERWLSATLARELGVWANPWFPFPRALIELFLDASEGAKSDGPRFEAPSLIWQIAAELPNLLADGAFADVAGYLRHDREREQLLELSARLADSFDQYVIYRPEMIAGWQRGDDAHFQAKLFRRLRETHDAPHLAERMLRFSSRLSQGLPLRELATSEDVQLPERISLFGISTLPPAFLGMLSRLGEQLDVHVFLLAPSREYWGDLDRKVAVRRDLHGMLAQLGKIGREFIDLLERQPYVDGDDDLFEEPAPTSMLTALQADLIDLTARARRGEGVERPRSISERDDSLQVHVCHSMVRELEVLRDQLRARFERDPTLEPRDVVVFTPDIERYAPAIEAVFADRDERSIPFRIADRRAVHASPTAEAFFALIDLAGSRLALSDVIDFLHRACVRERFDIAEAELDRVQGWLVSAGARWAKDGSHRASFGQPAFDENSLRFALDRLLVGYAAQDGETRELFDVLPEPGPEGRSALLLGKLARFLETLFSWVEALSATRAPDAWTTQLSELLPTMLSDEGERANELHELRAMLAELGSEASAAGFAEPVTLASVRKLLEKRMDRGRANVGFLASGVTFCEPVPMRAIPFRVVCLLGMDDESFPRSIAKPSFDLMAAHPKPGDRTLRDDDRQLFLEALLSAREALHISYVGRSAQDGGERPCSVLVDQLLRLCDQHFVLAGDDDTLSLGLEGAVSKAMTHEHALHRFDARYFQRAPTGAYVSFDETAEQAARAQATPKQPLAPFVKTPLPSVPCPELTLDQLTRFYRHPQQMFLKERLKLFLPREIDEVLDREAMELSHLDNFRFGEELLERFDSHTPEERARLLRRAGKLAPGSVGAAQLAGLEERVRNVLDEAPRQDVLPERAFSLTFGETVLRGTLRDIEPSARVQRTVGKLNERRRLSAWITHLVLCATSVDEHAPRITRLVGRESKENQWFTPVSRGEAMAQLSELVALHRVGLCMPLPLFHEAAEEYAKTLAKSADGEAALQNARTKVVKPPSRGVFGASVLEDAYVQQLWSEEHLMRLDELFASDGTREVRFTELAERTYVQMLAHTTKKVPG